MRFLSAVFPFHTPPSVKALITANCVVWLFLIVILQGLVFDRPYVFWILGLTPNKIFFDFHLWQVGTYMFVHSSGVFHILFNMFALYMFGSELERLWGPRFFLTYYAVCGIGAGLIYLLCIGLALVFHISPGGLGLGVPMVGASGAIFGILLAYGLLFGDRIIYFMMLFPIKARYFTALIGLIEFVSLLNSGTGGTVSHLAHLSGFAAGFLFLQSGKILQKAGRAYQRKSAGFKILNGGKSRFFH